MSNITSISTTVNYYLKPITKNEQMGYYALFAGMVLGSVAVGILPITFTAVKLAADAAIGAVAYLITVVAYRSLMLYGAEEKFHDFEAGKELGWPIEPNDPFKFCKDLADRGHIQAQKTMGDWYRYGAITRSVLYRHEEVNLAEATKYYKMASDRGDGSASNSLSQMYYTLQDDALAFKYAKLAVSQGCINAHLGLGLLYRDGRGVDQDTKQAFDHINLVAKAEDSAGQVTLGKFYEQGIGCYPSNSLAFFHYEAAAKQGNAKGQINLGRFYEFGIVTDKPYTDLAFKYYDLAAKQKDPMAQMLLGSCYENGIGCEINLTLALHYYELSANQGNATAQVVVGNYYEFGIGCTQNIKKAFNYYDFAAKQQDAMAQVNLGRCYEHGIGCEQDHDQAFLLYDLAAKQDNLIAKVNLGRCYQYGIGCEEDQNQAFLLYNLALNRGYTLAQVNLGHLYLSGQKISHIDLEIGLLPTEITQDLDALLKWRQEKALELFMNVVNAGVIEAWYEVGHLFESQKKYKDALKAYEKLIKPSEAYRKTKPLEAHARYRAAIVSGQLAATDSIFWKLALQSCRLAIQEYEELKMVQHIEEAKLKYEEINASFQKS